MWAPHFARDSCAICSKHGKAELGLFWNLNEDNNFEVANGLIALSLSSPAHPLALGSINLCGAAGILEYSKQIKEFFWRM